MTTSLLEPPGAVTCSSADFPAFIHRAATALRAISFRCSEVSTFALAWPPFEAPRLESSFAALLVRSVIIPDYTCSCYFVNACSGTYGTPSYRASIRCQGSPLRRLPPQRCCCWLSRRATAAMLLYWRCAIQHHVIGDGRCALRRRPELNSFLTAAAQGVRSELESGFGKIAQDVGESFRHGDSVGAPVPT